MPDVLDKPKKQPRASLACASCRVRRTKCVVAPGKKECEQCIRNGLACVIRDDDERKRPTSKAYINSLHERIRLLENLLVDAGRTPPPASYPPPTTRSESSQQSKWSSPGSSSLASGTKALPAIGRLDGSDSSSDEGGARRSGPLSGEHSMSPEPFLPTRSIVDKLLSTSGHLAYDRSSGRLRYFGPTTNFHVFSDLSQTSLTNVSREREQRTRKVIQDLAIETQDYLMDLYWTNYNAVLHVIHQDAFLEDKERGGGPWYSLFLHVCILAMGYRFADLSRADMQNITLPNRESLLHKEAKHLFEYELEKPGGVPSVQALLLLGDLECGCGRDNTGWMYSGMACRLAFDVGLNLDCRDMYLTDREMQIRHMVLWACVVYDKYWALFLGRPTSIKSTDLAISQLSNQFERLGNCLPSGPEKSLETQVYEALLDLMDIAGKITESLDLRPSPTDPTAYRLMTRLDRELNGWYTGLPTKLRWSPINAQTAPFSFFLLHQQYHSTLILLHRPFALYDDSKPGKEGQPIPEVNQQSKLSRAICFDNAVRVARMFRLYRERFETRRMFITGLQHAGTAATALIAGITTLKSPSEQAEPLEHLQCLAEALFEMSFTYQPAERMSNVLRSVLRESGWELGPLDNKETATSPAQVPSRREIVEDKPQESSMKRRQTLPPSAAAVAGDRHYVSAPRQRAESFSSVNQRSGFGLDSVVPPQSNENIYWTNPNPTYNPFLDSDRRIMEAVDTLHEQKQRQQQQQQQQQQISNASFIEIGDPLMANDIPAASMPQYAAMPPEGWPDAWGELLDVMNADPNQRKSTSHYQEYGNINGALF